MNARTGSHARFVHDWCGAVLELPEGWRDAASPGRGVARALPVRGGVAPLGLPSCGSVASLGLPSWGGVTSLYARTRGEPSSARCEQRLSDGSPLARAIPCAPAPEVGVTRQKKQSWQHAGKTMQPRSKKNWRFCLRSHTQRSEPCRDGGVGWGGWGPIWRAQGV